MLCSLYNIKYIFNIISIFKSFFIYFNHNFNDNFYKKMLFYYNYISIKLLKFYNKFKIQNQLLMENDQNRIFHNIHHIHDI